MNIQSLKTFIYKVLGIEEASEWISSEKVNIFLTAILPVITPVLSAFILWLFNHSAFWSVLIEERFLASIQILVIVCTLIVLYRLHRTILVTSAKEPCLSAFLKKKSHMRDKSDETIKHEVFVIKKIVWKFYNCWLFLWLLFFVYYSGNFCFSFLKNAISYSQCDKNILYMIENSLNNILNYLSSTAMFFIFIILNSVTVSSEKRKSGRHGVISAIFFVVVFGCSIIFPTLFSFSLRGVSYIKMQMLISLSLGVYSAFSFVLVLGKLNNNLRIPRFIFYWLYLYALIQIFQFALITQHDFEIMTNHCNSIFAKDLRIALKSFMIVFEYITFFGKIFLSLTLLWIVYDSKFIFFIIQQNRTMTEIEREMGIFSTYMKDVE